MKTGGAESIIIGAGITGLTAAFYLSRKQKDFLVLEQDTRPGGVIRTHREAGFVFESGPNTGVLGQPEAAVLFEDLGESARIEIANDHVKKRYILKNGKWNALPSGLMQAIGTPLFTTFDKFRILGEPFRKKGTDPEESLKELVIRRMGKSFLDYAVDPFILGVYAGDPATLIPKYALPKLYNLEQDYGSFIRGSIKKRKVEKSDFEKKATREVFSAEGGLQSLTDALYRSAGEEHFRLARSGIKIKQTATGFELTTSGPGGPEKYETRRVIITTGAHSLPSLLPDVDKKTMQALTDIRYAPVIEVALGFKEWGGMTPDGFGGLIPFKEQRDLLGVLFPSAFLSHRAPEGGALFTIFIGGVRRPELAVLEDQDVYELVKKEFTSIMGNEQFNPDLFRIFRYPGAIPQYEISSGKRFRVIQEIEQGIKGLLLRGNFQGGIGLADRIRQGRLAAEEIIEAAI